MDTGTAKYVPLSQRTNARKKFQKARKKTSLIGGKTSEAELKQIFKTVQEKTGLSEKEVKNQFEEFMKICPNGSMTKKKFIELSRAALGDQADFLSDSLFRVFDEDNSGTMDFTEYMLAINATSLESPEDKLKWMFDVFDKDGGGTISPQEIRAMLQGLFEMSGQEFDEEDLDIASKGIMDVIDVDGDGEVTKKEFIANAMKSEFIASMLT